MPRELTAYLTDIPDAGEGIAEFMGNMSVEQYQASDLIRSAVERKFSIIGEAISQALDYYPELSGKIDMERDVVDFRNRIVHGCFTTNDVLIYSIAKRDLPSLMAEVKALLSEMPS